MTALNKEAKVTFLHTSYVLNVTREGNIFDYYRCSISEESRGTSGLFQLLVYNFASSCIFKLVVILKRLCWICARGAHTDTF